MVLLNGMRETDARKRLAGDLLDAMQMAVIGASSELGPDNLLMHQDHLAFTVLDKALLKMAADGDKIPPFVSDLAADAIGRIEAEGRTKGATAIYGVVRELMTVNAIAAEPATPTYDVSEVSGVAQRIGPKKPDVDTKAKAVAIEADDELNRAMAAYIQASGKQSFGLAESLHIDGFAPFLEQSAKTGQPLPDTAMVALVKLVGEVQKTDMTAASALAEIGEKLMDAGLIKMQAAGKAQGIV